MSKSKNNGVDPQDLIEKYGADTARLYTMFTAPPEATLEWNDAAVEGSYRFLRRVWDFGVKLSATERPGRARRQRGPADASKAAKALRLEIHTVLKQVDYDYQRMQYNTVVSGAMKMLNALDDFKSDGRRATTSRWPKASASCCAASTRPRRTSRTACGANWATPPPRRAARRALAAGRRGRAAARRDRAHAADQRQAARQRHRAAPAPTRPPSKPRRLASEAFVKQANGAAPKKVVVVPGRLVNVVSHDVNPTATPVTCRRHSARPGCCRVCGCRAAGGCGFEAARASQVFACQSSAHPAASGRRTAAWRWKLACGSFGSALSGS